ncbi:hypothetical protein C5167_020997 [Papaver somniferum]|uniref:Uncharacterized protein n=1 Tax=Papaver somniferum TaxID=3469 RepID=A0A4Y7IYT1_PAPSO|nr:hypothetical protein C5167_020997 [Papaver somniferum]
MLLFNGGRVAIITGAAGGIGEAAARLFVENGAFVVIADVQVELGDQVVASIGPERCCYKHCDVTDEKQVEETVAYTLEKYGTLDIVYSNAAMIKHAGRAMVAQNIRGSIICTVSIGGTRGGIGPPGYTASKHALLGVVRSASRELGIYGIRGKDIAEAVLFLASDESASISGHDLVVDGAFPDEINTFPVNIPKIAVDLVRWYVSKDAIRARDAAVKKVCVNNGIPLSKYKFADVPPNEVVPDIIDNEEEYEEYE